ncbi:MAG: hypothetical protein PVH88_26850 [Ignavibacteria bacterium]|jgi:hypothetical protein
MQFRSIPILFLIIFNLNIVSQVGETPIKVFGYFQTTFTHSREDVGKSESTSFNIQQLNIILQKDLAKKWTAFTNLEFVNTFSSSKLWGDFNLDEVWVRYRHDSRLILKLGLSVPIFNNFNEINNKTPVMPYIIRPIAYETSFGEFIDIEEYVPQRTFVQAYGHLTFDDIKLDYAFHLGNSPNISSRDQIGQQSGTDTTKLFSYGGRLGIRKNGLKFGISGSYDRLNNYKEKTVESASSSIVLPDDLRNELPRYRVGSDLSFFIDNFFFEGEFINVIYDDKHPLFKLDKTFYYATVGYNFCEDIIGYITYWRTKEYKTSKSNESDPDTYSTLKIPGLGISYDLNDRTRLKLQFAPVEYKTTGSEDASSSFTFFGLAISVFF